MEVDMPDGVMKWFDQKSGEGRNEHLGREYVALEGDVDPEARVSRARVHFDARRDEGTLRAVKVSLREGTRVSAAQSRFGDQVGAHDVRDKGQGSALTHGRPTRDPRGKGKPMEVAQSWMLAIARGDLSTAVQLYAPGAVLHSPGRSVHGKDAVRGFWAASMPTRWVLDRGEGDDMVVLHAEQAPDTGPSRTRLRIRGGEIVEQWLESP